MKNLLEPVLDTFDGILAWMSQSLGQAAESYCMLETADDKHTLVGRDGSLISIIKIHGAKFLVGPEEFDKMHLEITQSLQTALSRPGHALQLFYTHDKDRVKEELENILVPARQTAKRLEMGLDDLFGERISNLKKFCASESIYLALWTRPSIMTKTQSDQVLKEKNAAEKKAKVKAPRNAQNLLASIPALRDSHEAYIKSSVSDLNGAGLFSVLLDVHDACHAIRSSVDPEFTDLNWKASLPGDPIPNRSTKNYTGDVSDVLWPPLSQQLIPRDGENLDLRTARIGDRIYSSVFIDLFPKELAPFMKLFQRVSSANVPWRISFMIESEGLRSLGIKPILSTILSFASNNNKLLNNAVAVLNHLQDNTDEAIVKLKVSASTWAPEGELALLRTRAAELAKAIQGWGYTETSEISGDAYGGVLSSCLGLSTESHAIASVAPFSDVSYLFPITRPSSPWTTGAVMFRSPDGKPWPYQPGSTLQTTWIDLIYARPGSGKSVLSNSINLALVLSGGIQRLPRIAIIDIGPSSSGLVSLIKESLPENKKHLVTYHRLRMVKEMSINPFDTQLGCRKPLPQDRAFLVNFLTLLATPVGETKPYDAISDMAGLIVDEMYATLEDDANPKRYARNIDYVVDAKIDELNIQVDQKTSWWEIADQIFKAGYTHEASIAQRYAMPLLADAASICRTGSIEDLYGDIKAPTGERLIDAFGRMISSAVREYPILSQVTAFDLGEAKIVSLDLDEVAKTGGAAADRQTAVMYMLARYVLARHYYLTEESVSDFPSMYQEYHTKRIKEIREDPKRIVMDEFHRTAKAKAVRDQVIVDMREGRKWKVQVALLSQSLDDFDSTMVEFGTSIFILDAGPKQAIDKSCEIFGLSDTARLALSTRVHGPRASGATFLAQFATKAGINTQLLTSTIGPIELWAFNTTAEDARIRNALYKEIGAKDARKILAMLYPTGSAAKVVEERLARVKVEGETVTKEQSNSIIDQLVEEIIGAYKKGM